MAEIKIPTSFNIDLEFESADIMKRFIAWLIDLAVRLCYFLMGYLVLTSFRMEYTDNLIIYMFLIVLPILFYFPIAEIAMGGQTPGKKVMHVKVVSMVGNRPSISQHLIRWIFRMVESPLLFYIFFIPVIIPIVAIMRTSYSQRLGDLIAGTIVISTKRKGSIEETIFRDMSNIGYQPQFPQIMKLSDRDMNKVKDLLDRALKARDEELAARVAFRVKEVLQIQTDMPHTSFLETVLNDYNYYTTKDN
ncbi:putative RDD family membrane protein YckC [Chitinophaga niastensis]|uniref:Putative RDD family membrane protein YckC n=1 Tax=Chitinophaga niastensis TaxID=536980 RepID=A0A2P8HMM6_CHINA|nr:RDD family protein [Chitinophaga niastensis]PSL47460.1 putative RDD family membrane protein YckC [Chitinophaga niastensis]